MTSLGNNELICNLQGNHSPKKKKKKKKNLMVVLNAMWSLMVNKHDLLLPSLQNHTWVRLSVIYFTKEVNHGLAKPPLKFTDDLAKPWLTS